MKDEEKQYTEHTGYKNTLIKENLFIVNDYLFLLYPRIHIFL
jgi:hypothetical protein